MMDVKVLRVGQELIKETLPLQSGSRLYEMQGLNSNKWYEVKISYPASIAATFTLQLSKGSSGLSVGRKLLNTEKIIFQGDSLQLLGDKNMVKWTAFLDDYGPCFVNSCRPRVLSY
ncbi:uncharacterized protein LOC107838844 isoform X2 [Capsicum annuum]|uniref:uncharacterized protein LOC107838844 isoform X2 n=1 Tax=Capsicum annuum TaxID=4072 RepID=UPI0007BF2BDF|nr:uncharacterized protein LOC107838844 isoform X2 [Capsicum annuum]